ncbi:arsenate-mycothiol transferase ArsC [Amycolatopsis pithecellobii]|uniref:Phosphotyrosine protein phosphatase I domain-containing protein n=1 Tax=Amycolatopsis pithecellobii TaxID=664692 RepID=A0A6N7Z550_9PSEU|nr:hypothetical protein [Amycolatopsis pithecellobii]MTD54506.1 hypothetical protein [Amycolatopsis pithecellobii]
MAQRGSTRAFRILFVGTENRIRSPLAELLTRQLLRTALGPMANRFAVSSAGIRALPGSAMDPRTALALRTRGLAEEASTFRTAGLTGRQLKGADLVLTAERPQHAAVVALEPVARTRTFCLLELGRLLPLIDTLRLPRDPVIRARAAAEAGRQLREDGAHETTVTDDIPDPTRFSDYSYTISATLVESAVHRFVSFLKPVTNPPEVPT